MNKLSVVLYKNQPAIVNDRDGDKYIIKFCTQPATPGGKKAVYGEQKVREKDVVLLHEGPCTSLEAVLACDCGGAEALNAKLLEAYELLMSDESTASEAVSLSDHFLTKIAISLTSVNNLAVSLTYIKNYS